MSPFVQVAWATAAAGISIRSTSQGNEGTATSHTVTLPSGASSGDVVVVAFGAPSTTTISAPVAWTVILHSDRWATIHRKLDGSEGASFTVTTSDARNSTFIAYCVTGAHGDVEASSSSTAPPIVTPAWGNAANLWITWAHTRNNDGSWTPPASYGSVIQEERETGTTSTRMMHASAHRVLEASSETPGAWTYSGIVTGERYATVAVRPA